MVLGHDLRARQHVHAAVDPAGVALQHLGATWSQACDLDLELVIAHAPELVPERQLRAGQERSILKRDDEFGLVTSDGPLGHDGAGRREPPSGRDHR